MHSFTDSYTLLFLSPVRTHFEGNLLFSDEKGSEKKAISFAHFFWKETKNGLLVVTVVEELTSSPGK